ncbi:MAG: hypothetical protein UV75_C0001G0005 [Candidatus Giovannonibacteria bacterium GW2011_GWA1_43_15]|uniref:GIY-YIG domain-containing protein n=2 Tax=Candidatus Giovannoniibacteriota TaxID=1752738 RepID=A0A0G1IVU8_9BACT|nr:MAG: hypothetical protein UV72_C0002G0050 [Candidatus Giovannonibacteria bacterium GW2011_GWB1_43_13]KKS99840.1 MAG: hypothetical protein UV75_C0001G0005 [Candidatus Giovannonibacteria bacterium GW2011_GWA1_43_15]KKT63541.1 MAG: hypothetical protein UW55_C0002G0006 [Candidatus Giovannonibacteria bacterium GW2011_GWA2_44_26]OGF85866.1 MAG: hypothetical protein A3I28_01500 [Candidatus Giovannonibacteria bacterium RIFCSPLOWO2_02_FULL_43_37]OGF91613.1 MAG: hypothetical protein A3H05_01730 [Candi
MFYVYLIKNNNKRWYIGSTNDLKRRMTEHNAGKNFSTKYDKTWKLIYYEAYLDEHMARIREKKLKSFGSAFGHLLKRLDMGNKKREG